MPSGAVSATSGAATSQPRTPPATRERGMPSGGVRVPAEDVAAARAARRSAAAEADADPAVVVHGRGCRNSQIASSSRITGSG